MKLVKNICRLILGLVFLYSGFVKGIDPLGSNYKFIDYFYAFHMSWLNGLALFLSFAWSSLEFITGFCLTLNIKIKPASWIILILMLFLTPLTMIIAFKNPVSDCGCFGDAITLTNWETFGKNILLLLFSYIVFINRHKYTSSFFELEQNILLGISFIVILSLETYCYRHLPIIDFRPYSIGKNISEEMNVPEGAPQDEYEITLQYKNLHTGEVKDFTEENYPWQDTLNWTYVNSSEKLLHKGYTPAIHDFIIEHPEYGNITDEILQNEEYTFLIVSYQLNKASEEAQNTLNELALYANEKGYQFYGLTASLEEDIQKHKDKYQIPYEFCNTDEIQLKTMIRSNPGIILLHKGTIINKWSHRDFPKLEEIKDKELVGYCLTEIQNKQDRLKISTLFLLFVTCLVYYLYRKYRRYKH